VTDVILPHDVHGHGSEPVIALHGWLSDRHAFDAMVPLLDGAECTVAIPDIRGYGKAVDIAGEFTMAEVARDTLTLADHLDWESFSLIGHSMGGKAAQQVLAMAPGRVRKIVGISPVPATGVPFDDPAEKLFHSAVSTPSARREIIDMGTGHRYHPVWLDRMADHSVASSTTAACAGYLASWSGTDFHRDIVGMPVPMKVVVGAHDPDLDAETMRATFLRWYPHCDLEVIESAGHYAIDETPVALAAIVHEFIRPR
jgi:pimeloyl-ACP methyl ester carboxylesterase